MVIINSILIGIIYLVKGKELCTKNPPSSKVLKRVGSKLSRIPSSTRSSIRRKYEKSKTKVRSVRDSTRKFRESLKKPEMVSSSTNTPQSRHVPTNYHIATELESKPSTQVRLINSTPALKMF